MECRQHDLEGRVSISGLAVLSEPHFLYFVGRFVEKLIGAKYLKLHVEVATRPFFALGLGVTSDRKRECVLVILPGDWGKERKKGKKIGQKKKKKEGKKRKKCEPNRPSQPDHQHRNVHFGWVVLYCR